MSYKLHVATKYEVTWGGDLGFNHKLSEFHILLTALGVNFNISGESLKNFEINRTELDISLEDKLRRFSRLDENERKVIELSLRDAGISLEKTIRIFENILKQADPRNDLIYCAFF